jgi:hypothetical protein
MTIFFASPVAMSHRPRACMSGRRPDRARAAGASAAADDGAGDEVREEADEEEVVEVAVGRLELAAVDVDRVAHRLEREERDAERQDEAQVRDARRGRRSEARSVNESTAKFQVLEDREDAQVVDDRDEEQRLALLPGLSVFRARGRSSSRACCRRR